MPDQIPQGTEPTPQPLRVLLVEDDPLTLEFVSRLLVDAGAAVTEAESLLAATECLGREPFDLLVTDFVLRDGTGVDVALAARGLVERMVLVSGELGNVPLGEAREAGLEVFIPKFELTGERVRSLLADLFSGR